VEEYRNQLKSAAPPLAQPLRLSVDIPKPVIFRLCMRLQTLKKKPTGATRQEELGPEKAKIQATSN
jgi:hypothetical protein